MTKMTKSKVTYNLSNYFGCAIKNTIKITSEYILQSIIEKYGTKRGC